MLQSQRQKTKVNRGRSAVTVVQMFRFSFVSTGANVASRNQMTFSENWLVFLQFLRAKPLDFQLWDFPNEWHENKNNSVVLLAFKTFYHPVIVDNDYEMCKRFFSRLAAYSLCKEV